MKSGDYSNLIEECLTFGTYSKCNITLMHTTNLFMIKANELFCLGKNIATVLKARPVSLTAATPAIFVSTAFEQCGAGTEVVFAGGSKRLL